MKILATTVCALALGTSTLAAQNPPRGPENMRVQVTQRFLGMYSQTAGLTEEQTDRLAESLQDLFEWTGEHGARMRGLWQALEAQMRPGVAADVDSLNVLMTSIAAGRAEEAERLSQHERELASFLSPVQRAQFMIHWERFQRQIETIRGRRGMMQGAGPPGTGPGGSFQDD